MLDYVIRQTLVPELPTEGENVYSPSLLFWKGCYYMWYGGQGIDGHDRIHLAVSQDNQAWHKLGVVLDNGKSNHVNDPCVLQLEHILLMYYTRADIGTEDRICCALSKDGIRWKEHGIVLDKAKQGFDSVKLGRPSVMYEDGLFKMWYDGTDALESRSVGYACSTDGLHFSRWPTPVVPDAGAVNVTRAKNRYIMLSESRHGVCACWGESETSFSSKKLLLKGGLTEHDAHGHVTPRYFPKTCELFLGLASMPAWDRNTIGRIHLPLTR